MGLTHEKKQTIIVIIGLTLAIGQFSVLFMVQSRVVWNFDTDTYSGSPPWGGELTLNLPSNPLYSRYAIKITGYFYYSGEYVRGNLTFFHLASNQSFFFEYYLRDAYFIGEKSAEKFWFLPSGMYNITWTNSDRFPDYDLIGTSFFYPQDPIVIMISGFVLLIAGIALIRPIISIIKNISSRKNKYERE